MRTFARIDSGVVVEILPPADFPADMMPTDGDIRSIYHPDFVATLVEITDMIPLPGVHWTCDGDLFSEPEPIAEVEG